MNKNYFIIVVLIIFSLFITSCKRNNSDNNNSLRIDDFSKDVNDIINIIQTTDYDMDKFSSDYNLYYINKNRVYGYNYIPTEDTMGYNMDVPLDGYNIVEGFVIQNFDGKLYATMKNDKYCAIKDFDEEEIIIFDIKYESDCHRTYLSSEDLMLKITGKNNESQTDDNYNFIDDEPITLSAISNILDDFRCVYTWYRNGEEIENSNIRNYVITSEVDGAYYSVKVTLPNGKSAVSNPVSVKINYNN